MDVVAHAGGRGAAREQSRRARGDRLRQARRATAARRASCGWRRGCARRATTRRTSRRARCAAARSRCWRGIRERVGFATSAGRLLYTTRVPYRSTNMHHAARLLSLGDARSRCASRRRGRAAAAPLSGRGGARRRRRRCSARDAMPASRSSRSRRAACGRRSAGRTIAELAASCSRRGADRRRRRRSGRALAARDRRRDAGPGDRRDGTLVAARVGGADRPRARCS